MDIEGKSSNESFSNAHDNLKFPEGKPVSLPRLGSCVVFKPC